MAVQPGLFPRRAVLQLAAGSILLPSLPSARAQVPMVFAINRTARFRALSQRCAKAYAQVFLDVLPDNARDVLASTQRLIQLSFDDLAKANFPEATQRQLAQVREEGNALAQMLAAPASRQAVQAVSQQADRMLVAANKATEMLETQSRQASAKLVSLSGRQRMLSQRLAKNYFLVAAGLDSKGVQDQIASDRGDFADTLVGLGRAPLSTDAIRGELSLGQQQWVLYDAALKRRPDTTALTTVATTSERVLEVMNNLTSMYEAALKDLLGTS